MELLTKKPQGKKGSCDLSAAFGKVIFLEDTPYLVHCTKMYKSTASLPGVCLEVISGERWCLAH